MEFEIVITCVLLVALMFLALIDMAFAELSDVGLRRMIAEAEERPTVATTFLDEILDNRSRFRFTLTTVIQVLLVAITVLVTSITYEWLTAHAWFSHARFLIIAALVSLTVAGLFRQLIPRLIASRRPDATRPRLLPLLRPVYRPLALLSFTWHKSFDRPRRAAEQQTENGTTEEEEEETTGNDIKALLDVAEDEGIIEEEEGDLIRSTIEFGDTRVNEVMTPRTEIVALPLTATVQEARDAVVESKYSRLPVYREQIDHVEGIIYVRDLLQCWCDGREQEAIEPLLRPAYFIPTTKPVAELLEEMQKAHVQLAMVIDEYGGVAGLVTVEDI